MVPVPVTELPDCEKVPLIVSVTPASTVTVAPEETVKLLIV